LAWDGYGASPTAKIECGPSAGRGTASETLALPSPSASAGEPLNSAPEDASSSRKAIASFAAKPLSEPDRVARPEPPPNEPSPRVAGASVRLAAPTVTAPLLALSRPRQFAPITGVTVYSQLPNGTPVSVQVNVATTPLQPARVVCGA